MRCEARTETDAGVIEASLRDPERFALLAYGFAALCALTIATRLWFGWKALAP